MAYRVGEGEDDRPGVELGHELDDLLSEDSLEKMHIRRSCTRTDEKTYANGGKAKQSCRPHMFDDVHEVLDRLASIVLAREVCK